VNDAALARSVADEAGALLRALCTGGGCTGRELGERGDREANALILERLKAERPDDFVLSEEAADDGLRCAERRVWIVDPLDGTREYSSQREDWAVHIGLAIDGRPVDGAVALPMLGRTIATDATPALQPLGDARPRMLVSRSRCPDLATRVAEAIGAELVPMGSAGAKAMAVLEGRAEIYLHAGGQYEWDNCAPVAVAKAAGLHASRIDGSEIVYNCRDPLVPDLLICRVEWAERVLAAVATVSATA
jgi:3'(2'), 5'-bisphosphate nucleotidase